MLSYEISFAKNLIGFVIKIYSYILKIGISLMFILICDLFTTSNISVELLSNMTAGHILETVQRTTCGDKSSN